ncbi:TetR/AcrR family transcriptional regulator [Mycolicibacterium canariasense]|uniref:TetR/AcrR family transcriptional regulator n=1 Tax=Mycolicibacterium canariasense TaxID=228230 RepID=UPI001F314533|nr:TetR/AcrR family transcriptional regulator [Mycolicibacterium canariasense]
MAAAAELATERGAEGWSLREVSARVGVAPSAAYHHFESRGALVSTLAEHIQASAGKYLALAVSRADTDDPVARLVAYARAYVRWTVDNPGLAALAFAANRSPGIETIVTPHPHDILVEELNSLVTKGFLASDARPGAEFAVWAGVHGLAMLSAEGMIRHRNRRTTDLEAERLVRAILSGLSAPTTPPCDASSVTAPHAERLAARGRAFKTPSP